MEFYSSEQKVLKDYLEHYGVKGMKWGRTKISKITSSDMIRKEAAKRTTNIANAALMQNASALANNGSGGAGNYNKPDSSATSINQPGSSIGSFGDLLKEKEKEREKKREIMLERLRRNADGLKNKSYKQAVSEGKQKINMVKNAIAKLFS